MNTYIAALVTDHYDGPGPWWPIFPIFWLLAFIAVAVVVFVTAMRRRRWQDCGPSSGRSRLAERFAAGEIDEDEYRTRRAVLNEKDGR